MNALVAGVERYPEFLPWCKGARVWERGERVIKADLIIGYKMFQEKFTSRVTLDQPKRIWVEYLSGPLSRPVGAGAFLDTSRSTKVAR